jgi:hypothetical protein
MGPSDNVLSSRPVAFPVAKLSKPEEEEIYF